ncbi:MAG: EAL domain-containing protein [Deltaproteobacteria bacterium]|nr:EAL domain-containing protein [Deltaproteobacteria bacterium]
MQSPFIPATSPRSTGKGRVLIVDDEPAVLAVFRKLVARDGFDVETAESGEAALELVRASRFDAIVSDIAMPGMSGIDLLRAVRAHDLDVPVLLLTGGPSVETAAYAVELGAYRYLLKPIEIGVLVKTIGDAVARHRLAQVRREAAEQLGATAGPISDRAGLEVRFQRALDTLWMAYQPVVSWSERRIYGYEALMRCREPALPHPGAVLDAAERLGRLDDLSRVVRDQVGRAVASLADGEFMLINLHANDLLDETLYAADSQLTRHAARVILEITERASLEHVHDVRARVVRLRAHGFRVAVDDLGAGYAGLTSLAQLEPDVVKLDMSLVRGVNLEPIKQRLVGSFATLCRDLHIEVIAEGVETAEERDAVVACGGNLLQGFLFGRPQPGFQGATWPRG